MTDTSSSRPPSTNPKSPYYDEALLPRGVGIEFDGQEKTNVEEYCVSEGWIRVAVGKTVDRKGNPLTIKLKRQGRTLYREEGSRHAQPHARRLAARPCVPRRRP